MKQLSVILILFALTISCQQKDDFVSLFNGENLDGWEVLNGSAPYTVEDGMIVGTFITNSTSSFLCTKKRFGDFILTFDAKFEEGNSGVQFRSQSTPEYRNGAVYGYQMELDPSKRAWTGGIYDQSRRGWLYPMEYNKDAKPAFHNGEWNSYRIEAIGNNLRTFVNGVQFADLVDDLDAEGFIGLQVHGIGDNEDLEGNKCMFKNIKICTTNLNEHKTPVDLDITQISYLTNKLIEK